MTSRARAPAKPGLLAPPDPAPWQKVGAQGEERLILICEHAGRAVPGRLGRLGVAEADLSGHVGWDVGAGALTRALAGRLGCAALLQPYSRLVIDCNRPPGTAQSIPDHNHGVTVPANIALSAADRSARESEIFFPFDRQVGALLDAASGLRAAFAVHSFTRHLGGADRPWDIGLLCRRDPGTARRLAETLAGFDPDLCIGLDQPYRIEDETDWFIPRHAEPRGIAHCLIEVRNDHLRSDAGIARWAARLAAAMRAVIRRAAAP